MASELPDGWTLERLREVSQDPSADLWPTDTVVLTESNPNGASEPIREALVPDVIIRFAYLTLVRPVGENDWYMGQVNERGEVVCWGSYGPDLEAAVRAL
jgi:hypothetical protein